MHTMTDDGQQDLLNLTLDQMTPSVRQKLAIVNSVASALGQVSVQPEAQCAGVIQLKNRSWNAKIANKKHSITRRMSSRI